MDELPNALSRNFASSGASEKSLRHTDCPVCQIRPTSPSPATIVCRRTKLSSATGLAAACCKTCGGMSTNGGQPLEINAGVSFAPARNSPRSEEHTSELQSHSFISYAVFCLKKK